MIQITPVSSASTPPARRVDSTQEGPSFADALRRALESASESERRMDAAVRRGVRGGLTPEELIALQARVYRYARELELASKLVDKSASAAKHVLQSQS